LIVNGIQIKKEIDAAISDFNSAQFFAFGEDVGTATALVFFGRPPRKEVDEFDVITSEEKQAFKMLYGYMSQLGATDNDAMTTYNQISTFGATFHYGVKKVFTESKKPKTKDEVTVAMMKLGFMYGQAAKAMKQMIITVDLTESAECLAKMSADKVTNEMVLLMTAAFDAYELKEWKDVGMYIGAIAEGYCPKSVETQTEEIAKFIA
jgi:hypothetical protein